MSSARKSRSKDDIEGTVSRKIGARIRTKLINWTIYGVALALSPIAVSLLTAATRNESASFPLAVGRGELLLIAVALCAAAAGELTSTTGVPHTNWRATLVGLNVLVAVTAALWYGTTTVSYMADGRVDASVVAAWSLVILVASITIAGASVAVAEVCNES